MQFIHYLFEIKYMLVASDQCAAVWHQGTTERQTDSPMMKSVVGTLLGSMCCSIVNKTRGGISDAEYKGRSPLELPADLTTAPQAKYHPE